MPAHPTHPHLKTDSHPQLLSIGNNPRHSELVSHYRNLYIENRADALEALDSLPQLKHVHSLKAKILFSMIVVSREDFNLFRS